MKHTAFAQVLCSALALLTGVAAAYAQDLQMAFNNSCRTCQSMKEADNRLGPSLAGVIGRKAGTLPGFQFSEPMKTSGITWDEATLDKFITNPDQVVAGNRMQPFTGVADAGKRKEIVAYLKSISGK
jgi:cytochrome c